MNTPEWTDGTPANDAAAIADALEWLRYLQSIETMCLGTVDMRERLARCIAEIEKRTGIDDEHTN